LLLGILIGARRSLPPQVLDDFTNTGVSHVIAISGYNISVIVASLAFLAKLIGRRSSFWISLLVIFAFVVVSGASSSVLRASIMGGLLLLSFQVYRPYRITPALCFAAALMLVWNPRILYWDVGFQLSFLATLGIVYAVPVLETLTTSWPNPFGTKTILLVSTSAILATMPLVLLQFGQVSLVALPVNILMLPFVPLTMLCGFLTALPVLGYGFGFVAHLLLQYMLRLTHLFARIPFSNAQVHIGPALFMVCVVAVGLLYSYLWLLLQHKLSLDQSEVLRRRSVL
jgi:competence protein ComEC